MKKVLKQKFFLIGVLLLLIAVGVGIGNSCRQNAVKSVDTFVNAVLSVKKQRRPLRLPRWRKWKAWA